MEYKKSITGFIRTIPLNSSDQVDKIVKRIIDRSLRLRLLKKTFYFRLLIYHFLVRFLINDYLKKKVVRIFKFMFISYHYQNWTKQRIRLNAY